MHFNYWPNRITNFRGLDQLVGLGLARLNSLKKFRLIRNPFNAPTTGAGKHTQFPGCQEGPLSRADQDT
jgi:hypothetical protein